MKKQILISDISTETGVSKASVEKVLNALVDKVGAELKSNGVFRLYGLGRFKINTRTKLRNPKTNELIVGGKVNCVSFSQCNRLKKLIN